MTHVALDPAGDSLLQLYVDVLWNLTASAQMVRVRLPAFAGKSSDPELLASIAEALRVCAEAGNALEEIASRFQQPARRHAAELEELLVSVATATSGWHAGSAEDLALTGLLRKAIHLGMPSCDLVMNLAPVVGYPAHAKVLAKVYDEITALDEQLRAVMHSLLGTHDRVGPHASAG